MIFPAAMRQHLIEDWSISSLVGDRVYPVTVPTPSAEADVPYQDAISFSMTSRSEEDKDISGAGLVNTTWEFQIVSREYDRAYEISDALISVLNNFYGPMPTSGGGVQIAASRLLSASDDFVFEANLYEILLGFEISYAA